MSAPIVACPTSTYPAVAVKATPCSPQLISLHNSFKVEDGEENYECEGEPRTKINKLKTKKIKKTRLLWIICIPYLAANEERMHITRYNSTG